MYCTGLVCTMYLSIDIIHSSGKLAALPQHKVYSANKEDNMKAGPIYYNPIPLFIILKMHWCYSIVSRKGTPHCSL